MIYKKFSEFSLEEQDQIVNNLMKKRNDSINELIENKLEDIRLSTRYSSVERQADIEYVNSKHYLIDVLSVANWAIFDEEYNMFIFETSCRGDN